MISLIVQSCLSKSTVPGLVNLGNAKNKYGKIFWSLLTLLMVICFVIHSYLLYNEILEENVLVSTFPDSKPFIQPDIVFCPERFFARDFINHPPEDEYEFMLNVSKEITKFNEHFIKEQNKSSMLIWNTLNYHKLYKAFFQRKHQLFLSIRCKSKEVNIDLLTVEMNYYHFACYRLHASSCRLNSPFDSLIVKFYTHNYEVNKAHSKLNVLINNRTIDEYLFTEQEPIPEMSDGIHVYLVSPNERISAATTKVTAAINYLTKISLRSTEYNRVSTTKHKCDNNEKYSLLYNLLEKNIELNPINVTSESACRTTIFQELLYKNTKRVFATFPIPFSIPRNFSFCGNIYESSKCPSMVYLWYDYRERIIGACKEKATCKSIRHTTSINYNHWPFTSTLKSLFQVDVPKRLAKLNKTKQSAPGLSEALNDFKTNPANINSWKINFAKVMISPGEYMSTVIEESFAYTYKNFLSDVGGIIGFYLGASLFTLFELIRLIHCTAKTIAIPKESEREVVAMV